VLLHILSLQRPEGGMMLDGETERMLGIDLDELYSAARQTAVRILVYEEWQRVDPALLLSTVILILVLEHHFAEDRARWAKVVAKSESWLNKIEDHGRLEIHGESLRSWAERFVRNLSPRF
jgi:hypothetical protein